MQSVQHAGSGVSRHIACANERSRVRQWRKMAATTRIVDQLTAFFAHDPQPDVLSAYLFGSHAEGRAHRESDVDIAVLLDNVRCSDERHRFEARMRLIGDLGSALKSNRVDVVVLDDAPPGLARAIVTRGRRVFCRDSEADHAFVRTILLRAADLDPWLDRTRRIKVEALRG
jgi:predicted nucleotidyltransferase